MMNLVDLLQRFGKISDEEKDEVLSEIKRVLPPDESTKIAEKLGAEYSEPPRIALIGLPGVGKSSTINALFNPQPPFEVGDVVTTTKAPQRLLIDLEERGQLVVIDCPGIGESLSTDEMYIEIYQEELADCDVALWIIQADTRHYSDIQRHIRDIMPSSLKERLVVGINQVDKMEPGDWIETHNVPSKTQEKNISVKVDDVKNKLGEVGVNPAFVVPYSAKKGYRLAHLFTAILKACPEKAWIIDGRKMIVLHTSDGASNESEASESAEIDIIASLAIVKQVLIELGEEIDTLNEQVASLKSHQDSVNLEAEIAKLENQISRLKDRLSALENKQYSEKPSVKSTSSSQSSDVEERQEKNYDNYHPSKSEGDNQYQELRKRRSSFNLLDELPDAPSESAPQSQKTEEEKYYAERQAEEAKASEKQIEEQSKIAKKSFLRRAWVFVKTASNLALDVGKGIVSNVLTKAFGLG